MVANDFRVFALIRCYEKALRTAEFTVDVDCSNVSHAGIDLAIECVTCGEGVADYRLTVTAQDDSKSEMAFGLKLLFRDIGEGHVVLPGAVYKGNRFRSKPYAYSCIVNDPDDFRPDLPNTISNVPRLPKIQLVSGDLSMPAIGIGNFSESIGAQNSDQLIARLPLLRVQPKSVWLLTEPRSSVGHPLLDVFEGPNGLEVAVLVPGVREGERYFGCGEHWVPSEDRGWRPRAGETACLRVRVVEFDAANPPELFRKLFDLRHSIWPEGGRHELPWSAACNILERKFNALNWDERYGYYACGDRLSRYANWQAGWVGGGISSHALLAVGSEGSRLRAMRTMDFMAGPGISPSGFFWSFSVDGQMYSDMIDMDYGHDWHLIRRSGDLLYFLVKQIWLAERQGCVSEKWRMAVCRCADAFVSLWNREGQFGQFVSQETGEIRVGSTASAAIAPAGLALAFQLCGNPDYLAVAQASALRFVDKFLNEGFTSGGPGEAAQCPDSESAFGLLESLITLYEVSECAARLAGEPTDDAHHTAPNASPNWLALAERAAHLAASWVMPYDFEFPKRSEFSKLDMRTTGSVFANSQNKHGAPGICTLSGVSLLKLYRATGDERYLGLLKEIAHGVTQYLSRADRPVFGAPEGYMCERVNTSDWEHPDTPVGEGFVASCWCESSALLTYAEVPGLYVQPDTGLVVILDHGEAMELKELTAESSGQGAETRHCPSATIAQPLGTETRPPFFVRVSNPTGFEMRLKVLGEPSTNLSEPLGQDFLFGCPSVRIPPQGEVVLAFDRESGSLIH